MNVVVCVRRLSDGLCVGCFVGFVFLCFILGLIVGVLWLE